MDNKITHSSQSSANGLSPEQLARVKIDSMLQDAGWEIVSRDDYTPGVSAAAIEEGLLQGHLEADYLLFLEGKAIGVLEAKKSSSDLSEIVAAQAENYTHQLLPMYQYWEDPLRSLYLPLPPLAEQERIIKRIECLFLHLKYPLIDDGGCISHGSD